MSKITRQSYKRKKIVMGFALFGAIGLVSTGFAAWVLSGSTSKSSDTSLEVGVVSDKSMSFGDIAIYETGDGTKTPLNTFSFEPDEDDHTGRVRTDGAEERLSLTAETTLNQAQNLGKLTAKVVLTDDTTKGTNYASAISKGYVVAPAAEEILYNVTPTVTNPGGLVFSDGAEKTATFSYEVAFQWGSFFGGMNPSLFFDSATLGGAGGATAGEDFEDSEVKTVLDELHALLDGVKVTLTLEADPN